MRIAIYGRVSTPKQSVLPQIDDLKAYAGRRPGWIVAGIYRDVYAGDSERRPGLQRLMADASRKLFDTVLVWKFDRFARSVRHLVTALDTFRELGIDFISCSEAIDTTTAYGKMTFTVLAAVAEIELSLIRERAAEGRMRARRAGKHCGRPHSVFDRGRALELRRQDPRQWSYRALGREFGVSKDTMKRELARFAATAGCSVNRLN